MAAGSHYPPAGGSHLGPIWLIPMVVAGLIFGAVLRLVTTLSRRPRGATPTARRCQTCPGTSCPAAGLACAADAGPGTD